MLLALSLLTNLIGEYQDGIVRLYSTASGVSIMKYQDHYNDTPANKNYCAMPIKRPQEPGRRKGDQCRQKPTHEKEGNYID